MNSRRIPEDQIRFKGILYAYLCKTSNIYISIHTYSITNYTDHRLVCLFRFVDRLNNGAISYISKQ